MTDILAQRNAYLFGLLFIVPFLLLIACNNKLSETEKRRVQSALSDSLLATTETWNVDLEIIENGVKKVHLTASYAATFSTNRMNATRFKGPVYIEIFDATGAVKTKVNANRAVYHTEEAKFELFGDVDVYTHSGRTLHSEYLMWNRGSNRISTKKFVIITTANDSIAGTGFTGTVDLSSYTIQNPTGQVVLE